MAAEAEHAQADGEQEAQGKAMETDGVDGDAAARQGMDSAAAEYEGEQAWEASGKTLPYERTEAHAAAAAKSVDAAPGNSKGKNTKGKGKGEQKCYRFMATNECPFGKDFWNRADTPGHP